MQWINPSQLFIFFQIILNVWFLNQLVISYVSDYLSRISNVINLITIGIVLLGIKQDFGRFIDNFQILLTELKWMCGHLRWWCYLYFRAILFSCNNINFSVYGTTISFIGLRGNEKKDNQLKLSFLSWRRAPLIFLDDLHVKPTSVQTWPYHLAARHDEILQETVVWCRVLPVSINRIQEHSPLSLNGVCLMSSSL